MPVLLRSAIFIMTCVVGHKPGGDMFHCVYPVIDWEVQLAYAERPGLGTRE